MLFEAVVNFKKTEEGGRCTPPKSGYHPQLKFGKSFTSVSIRLRNSGQQEIEMALGLEHDVLIELQKGSPHYDKISLGMELEFYEGHKLIGTGKVTKI